MKPFKFNGEEIAQVTYLGSLKGPKAIDIGMECLTVAASKRLVNWLIDAIKEIEGDQEERGVSFEMHGRKKTMVFTPSSFKKSVSGSKQNGERKR